MPEVNFVVHLSVVFVVLVAASGGVLAHVHEMIEDGVFREFATKL